MLLIGRTRSWLGTCCCAAVTLLALWGPSAAMAAAQVEVKVDVGEQVVYCDVQLGSDVEGLRAALSEGTPVSITWEIRVTEINSYWLNDDIGTVKLTRRVIPDLISRAWLLLDSSSGITRRVLSIEDAESFLVRLQRFPMVDRSLLKKDERYRLEVELQVQEGLEDKGWFDKWWRVDTVAASLDFVLP